MTYFYGSRLMFHIFYFFIYYLFIYLFYKEGATRRARASYKHTALHARIHAPLPLSQHMRLHS